MDLTTIPAGPLILITRFLLPDLPAMLRFAGACQSIRLVINPEVRLCALTRDTASHLADVLLREFSRAHPFNAVQLQVRLSEAPRGTRSLSSRGLPRNRPFLRDICAVLDGKDDDAPASRMVRVSANLRRHVVRVETRFHVLHALEPLGLAGNAATTTDLELQLTGPLSGVCAGRVMLTSDDGNRRLRDEAGAVVCAPVDVVPFTDGSVRALRALGVLVERWPPHL